VGGKIKHIQTNAFVQTYKYKMFYSALFKYLSYLTFRLIDIAHSSKLSTQKITTYMHYILSVLSYCPVN